MLFTIFLTAHAPIPDGTKTTLVACTQFLKQKYGYAKNKTVKLYLTVTKYCT